MPAPTHRFDRLHTCKMPVSPFVVAFENLRPVSSNSAQPLWPAEVDTTMTFFPDVPSTTCQHANELRLPCRSIARPSGRLSTQATLPFYGS